MSFTRIIALSIYLALALAAHGETVSFRLTEKGSIAFQIHGVTQNEGYVLTLQDLANVQETVKIDNFTAIAQPGILEAVYKSDGRAGVYKAALSLGAKDVPLPPHPQQTAGREFSSGAGKLDRLTGVINWSTTRPSVARLLVISHSGMIISKILPWHITDGTPKTVEWDFHDVSRVKSYRDYPALEMFVQYHALPQNWVVLGAPDLAKYPMIRENLPKLPDLDFGFTISCTPAAATTTGAGSDKNNRLLLKMVLDPRTENLMVGKRFEILVYLDGEFIHEESQGVNPYAFVLPSDPEWKGKRYITVNVLDYEGNLGSRTIETLFE